VETFWLHGKPRQMLRPALAGLSRYIATVETARHRIFQFVSNDVLPDNKIVVLCFEDAFRLGVLCAEIHQQWTFARCGLIGMANFDAGHVYVKSSCFDPFPFPDATPDQRAAIAELAEELDATRKLALAEVPRLTMTEIYNLVAWLKSVNPSPLGEGLGWGLSSGSKITPVRQTPPPAPPLKERGELTDRATQDRATAARAGIIARLHEQIDAAVANAYGWPADLPPAEIVARLVALNAARAAEEKSGQIRWLRPEYQIPRFGTKT
ncbi:MAG: hypothetical protein RLY97_675, partial [Pseudomonadota bacterium]